MRRQGARRREAAGALAFYNFFIYGRTNNGESTSPEGYKPMSNSNQGENARDVGPDLPECLQPGGELDTILRDSRRAAHGKASPRALHMQLCRQAENLRYIWHDAVFGPAEDAVLRHCIEQREGNDRFEAEAQQQYRQYADDYDLTLGDFIPEKLRQEVQSYRARLAYVQNSNATAAEDWNVFADMQQQNSQQGMLGLTTGLPKLDELLGGLRGLVFLAGDKGTGKTSLILYMVLAALRARADLAVLFYSLDMGKTRIYERLLCCEAGIDYRTLNDPHKSPQQEQRLAEAAERLRQTILPRLRVVERDFSVEEVYEGENRTLVRNGLTYSGITRDCNNLRQSCRANQVLIVVDLFQKMDPHGDVAEGAATDHYRLDVLQTVQNQSCCPMRPHGYPILVTSEIRKDATKSNLTRDDLKCSGRIASDADVVLLMWPDETNDNAPGDIVPTTLRIGKGREGVRREDLKLWFHHTHFRFHDEEPQASTGKLVPGNKNDTSAGGSHNSVDPLAE